MLRRICPGLAKHRYIPVFLADYWQPAPPLPSWPPGPIRPAHLSGALLSNANPTATLSLTAYPVDPILPFYPPQPVVGAQLVLGVGLGNVSKFWACPGNHANRGHYPKIPTRSPSSSRRHLTRAGTVRRFLLVLPPCPRQQRPHFLSQASGL